MAQTCGLSATQTLDIGAEEKTGRRRSIECPPTWVLLDSEKALEEVRSEASGSVGNEEDESSAVYSSYAATGWGSSL